MKRIVLSSVLLLVVSATARAQDPAVRLVFQDGLVTLSANNVLISELLSEWERVGGTSVKGLDRLPAERVTINLAGVHERTALDAVFGTTGYVSTLGVDIAPGKSLLKSIVVVPRSSAAAAPVVQQEIDTSIPEGRFAFPEPGDNAEEHARMVMEMRSQRPTQPSKADTVIPELRYQYGDPGNSEPIPQAEPPEEPDSTPEPATASKPGIKPEPKPKKPPSGN